MSEGEARAVVVRGRCCLDLMAKPFVTSSYKSHFGFHTHCYARGELQFLGGNDVTKAEFLDVLARDSRIGNKKEAGQAVDAVLDAITDVLQGGGEVNFTGFGKFAVAERGPRQGVNPRTGERIFIPGGKVPRFSAGSGLKKKVKGGG
jgi:DNA-binding protein HU-beta